MKHNDVSATISNTTVQFRWVFFSVLFTMPTTKNKNTHFIKKIPTKNLMKVKIPYFLVACKAKAE